MSIIRFKTELFDISKEPENPINPIAGQSILSWLQKKLPALQMSDADAEDWSWYSNATFDMQNYLIGSAVEDGLWQLQIVKHRSLVNKLLGQNKQTDDDPCVRAVKQALEQEAAFTDLAIEPLN